MEIDLIDISGSYRKAHELRHSRHDVWDRIRPSIFQYDYLSLRMLVMDIERLVAEVPSSVGQDSRIAIDIGCGKSPYRELLQSKGFVVKTLDIDANTSPDYVGCIEDTVPIRLTPKSTRFGVGSLDARAVFAAAFWMLP